MRAHAQTSFTIYPPSGLFPTPSVASSILSRLTKSMAESAFGHQRERDILGRLDRRFKRTLSEQWGLCRDLLRHYFEMSRQMRLMGGNFGQKREKYLRNVVDKIKEDYATFNKEIRKYNDEGTAMGKVKVREMKAGG